MTLAEGVGDDGRAHPVVWSAERDPSGLPTEGLTMSDKSPRQSPSKKSGKSIKEKRADKRAKEAESTGIETALHGKKH